jgi:hypothetical protein
MEYQEGHSSYQAAQFASEAEKLEESAEWLKLIDLCLQRLQDDPNDFQVFRPLALGYLKIGDTQNVEKYCYVALSLLPSISPDRGSIERILLKAGFNKNIPGFLSLNKESELYLGVELGQVWISDVDILEIDKQLSIKRQEF